MSMGGSTGPSDGRRLAAWVAVVAALLAIANLALYVAAVGGDMDAMFDPAKALAMTAAAQRLFIGSMLLDSFGYYLPMLIVGGYLWSQLRHAGGALNDMAVLCLVVYVVLGVAGTSMQIAALPPLAAAHADGDAMVRAASEGAWLALAHATENGLWAMEPPVFAFWGIVTGMAMRRTGLAYGRLLVLAACGYLALFVLSFAGIPEIVSIVELGVILLVPLWLLLTGVHWLRHADDRPQAVSGNE